MNYLEKIKKNPWHILLTLAGHGMLDWLPDKSYLKLMYCGTFGRSLNLDNPQTLNEKIQWLKLYDRQTRYTDLVDKNRAKEVVGGIIGKEYIIPTLGVWKNFDDIDFDALPNQFVLKCTHDSGGLVVHPSSF